VQCRQQSTSRPPDFSRPEVESGEERRPSSSRPGHRCWSPLPSCECHSITETCSSSSSCLLMQPSHDMHGRHRQRLIRGRRTYGLFSCMAESFSAKPPAPSAWTKGREVDPSHPCRHLPDSDEASSEFAPLLFFSGPGPFCPSLPIHGMDGPQIMLA
jgi:hypothetical protein